MPNELDQEDMGRILRNLGLLDLYRDLRALQRGEKLPDSAMIRIGKALQLEIDAR